MKDTLPHLDLPALPTVDTALVATEILDAETDSATADINGHPADENTNQSEPVDGDLARVTESSADAIDPDETKDTKSTDQALETALQDAVRAEADLHTHDEDDMDIDDLYAPDHAQLAPDSASINNEEPQSPPYSPGSDPMELESLDGDRIGAVDSPESGQIDSASPPNLAESPSPVYSPSIERVAPEPERESDDYEPPEATPQDVPSPNLNPAPVDSPPFSPAPPSASQEVVDEELADVGISHVSDIDKTQAVFDDARNGDVAIVQRGRDSMAQVVQVHTSLLTNSTVLTLF